MPAQATLDQHQADQQRPEPEPHIAGADIGAHPEAALARRRGLATSAALTG